MADNAQLSAALRELAHAVRRQTHAIEVLAVGLGVTKPCETCEGGGRVLRSRAGSESTCPDCEGSGSSGLPHRKPPGKEAE